MLNVDLVHSWFWRSWESNEQNGLVFNVIIIQSFSIVLQQLTTEIDALFSFRDSSKLLDDILQLTQRFSKLNIELPGLFLWCNHVDCGDLCLAHFQYKNGVVFHSTNL